MASNYTTNYGLCQWEPGDNFVRTEFNQDNAKIDAALGALAAGRLERSQVIKTVTNPTSINNVTIDVSDLDWNEWEYVAFTFSHSVLTSSGEGKHFYVDLNAGGMNGNSNGTNYFLRTSPLPFFALFLPRHSAANTVQALCIGDPCAVCIGKGTFADLTSLRIRYDSNLPMGISVTLWGAK